MRRFPTIHALVSIVFNLTTTRRKTLSLENKIEIKTLNKQTVDDDQKMPFKLDEVLKNSILKSHIFLQYVQDQFPGDQHKIIEEIKRHTKEHSSSLDIIKSFEIKIDHASPSYQELMIKIIGSYLHFINYDKYQKDNINRNHELINEFEILVNDYLRGFLLLENINLKSLANILGKEDGIKHYQRYVDQRTLEGKYYTEVEHIEDILTCANPTRPPFLGSFDLIEFDLGDGRVGNKVSKCKWATVLKEVDDPEYAYTIACHYDIFACKCMNPHFELTRTQTLAQDKEYCDFIWHDKRRNPKLDHPDNHFWKDLENHVS